MKRGELRSRVLEAVGARQWPTTETIAMEVQGRRGIPVAPSIAQVEAVLAAAWELGELARVGRRWSVTAIPQDVAGIAALANDWAMASGRAVAVTIDFPSRYVPMILPSMRSTWESLDAQPTEWDAWRAALEVLS